MIVIAHHMGPIVDTIMQIKTIDPNSCSTWYVVFLSNSNVQFILRRNMFFQHLKLVAFLIMVSILTARTTEESELYQALREALLTEGNLYALNKAFYPVNRAHNSDISLIINYKNVEIKNIQEKNDSFLAFDYDLNSDSFTRKSDMISVKSYSKDANIYMKYYMKLLNLTDITYYKLLSSLVSLENKLYKEGYAMTTLFLDVGNLTSNPSEETFREVLKALFQWVNNLTCCHGNNNICILHFSYK